MNHHCQALIIACIDFRLIDNIHQWAKKLGLKDDYDLLTVGGASQQIADPDKKEYREFLLKQIDISVKLHKIEQLILIHHEDCGAYGGKAAFASDEEELRRHITDMTKTEKIIKDKHSQLKIIKVYAKLDESFEKV